MDIQLAVKDLSQQSCFIWDKFLSPNESAQVLQDLHQSQDAESFKLSGTGNKNDERVIREDVRNDKTLWLSTASLTPTQKLFWNRLEEIKIAINELLFLRLWDFSGHYSHYPVGGFYRKHFDRFSFAGWWKRR